MKRSTFIKVCLGASVFGLVGGNLRDISRTKHAQTKLVISVLFPEGKDFETYWSERKQWLNSQETQNFTQKKLSDKSIVDFKMVKTKNSVEYHYSFSSAAKLEDFLANLRKSAGCDFEKFAQLGYKVFTDRYELA